MALAPWAAIIALAWLLRRPAQVLGLPVVIGEMLAGFLLGPTFLGTLAPRIFSAVFPSDAIRHVSELAALIVAAYCFVIGLEFDAAHLKGSRVGLAVTALVSALLPAVLGYAAAGAIATRSASGNPANFRLAVALCFSVTAFPVLLRIAEETGLRDRRAGIFSVGVSAILELLVWTSLPVIIVVATAGDAAHAYRTIAGVVCFLLAWFLILRPLLNWLWARVPMNGAASLLLLAAVGVGSALLSDRLGIHTNFGAFIGGLVVPRAASLQLARKIKPTCVALLPIFFAAAGLKTTLGLGAMADIGSLFGLSVLAYLAKLAATALAARFAGRLSWHDAGTTGHLMCAKGAIGFAIIEIFLSAKIIDAHGYSILAVVILANTIMAAWGVQVQRRWARRIVPVVATL